MNTILTPSILDFTELKTLEGIGLGLKVDFIEVIKQVNWLRNYVVDLSALKQTIKGIRHVGLAVASLTQGYSLLAAYY